MKKIPLFAIILAFATSCASQNNTNSNNMKNERLVYFSFDHHNTMMQFVGEKYLVNTMNDGRIHVVIDEGFPGEKEFYLNDSSIFDSLLAIVKTYKMDKYKNDYKPPYQVFDGYSWSLYYKYDSKRSVSSGGYMGFPDNYRQMHTALSDYFKQWREYTDGVLAIDYLRFTCHNNQGRDEEYTIERGENEATVTLRDAERNISDTIKVSNEYLQKLQELANSVQLKSTLYDYHSSDENATRCDYFVRYNTGDTLDGYTCYTKYAGHKESSILEFFHRLQEK